MIPTLLLTPHASRDRQGPIPNPASPSVRVVDGVWELWEGTTNLVLNPGIRNTAGYVISGSTISRNTTDGTENNDSLEVITTGNSSTGSRLSLEGMAPPDAAPWAPRAVSVDVRLVEGHRNWQIYAVEYNAAGGLLGTGSAALITPTETWRRYSAVYTPQNPAVSRTVFGVRQVGSGPISTMRLDSFQVEVKDHPTPFTFGTRAPGTLTAPHAAPLGTVLIRFTEGGVHKIATLHGPGTFGLYGTLAQDGVQLTIGTTRETHVEAVLVYRDVLPETELDRVTAMGAWSWNDLLPKIGGILRIPSPEPFVISRTSPPEPILISRTAKEL